MNTVELLTECYGRIKPLVHAAVADLDVATLTWRPGPEANTIGWLIWHVGRGQDAQIADVAGSRQVWLSGGWADRFGLSLDHLDTGYGHSPDQVAAVEGDAELLTGYYDATHARTLEYLGTLTDADLDRVVDTNWNPPVTLGGRLVSILVDDLEHAGQAAYVRGLSAWRGPAGR